MQAFLKKSNFFICHYKSGKLSYMQQFLYDTVFVCVYMQSMYMCMHIYRNKQNGPIYTIPQAFIRYNILY